MEIIFPLGLMTLYVTIFVLIDMLKSKKKEKKMILLFNPVNSPLAKTG